MAADIHSEGDLVTLLASDKQPVTLSQQLVTLARRRAWFDKPQDGPQRGDRWFI